MKYPRTYHLPDSPGATSDDKILKNTNHLKTKLLIYTEKLDGECTGFDRKTIHARSETSTSHPSQSWIRQLYNQIKYKIPDNIKIFGENVYAKHSIYYDKLTSYFYVFNIVNLEEKIVLSISDTMKICNNLELLYVPTLKIEYYDEKLFSLSETKTEKSMYGNTIEGFVVRNFNEFKISEFDQNVAKWVRKNHIQSDKHWKTNWIPNKLGKTNELEKS